MWRKAQRLESVSGAAGTVIRAVVVRKRSVVTDVEVSMRGVNVRRMLSGIAQTAKGLGWLLGKGGIWQ